ncbi:hypothetical protein [Thalassoglobus neptunius]|uniref:hypothetical protein n=1 Tax=Thalassoglobus neptunius TaxID=1938619 RepID=UPI0011B5AF53|nr:hypothetical protein [Thalassoglobus neptunius]
MKNVLIVAVLLGATTIADGREPILVPQETLAMAYSADYAPTPAGETTSIQPVPAGTVAPGTVICDSCDNPGIELYNCVKVIQARKIAPCAVPKIVSVPNPCYDPCKPCCQPKCVFVQICVPPCACEDVICRKGGDRMIFSYGKYAVKVTARRDTLVVNYDH